MLRQNSDVNSHENTQRKPRSIVVLGSTGSIGVQTLEVVEKAPDYFTVVGLSAGGSQLDALARQAAYWQVSVVGCAGGDEQLFAELLSRYAAEFGRVGWEPEVFFGPSASEQVAAIGVDLVLNGITGSVGLGPTLAALKSGSLLALANKESLIVGGQLVKEIAQPGQLIPVDSEHSALAQALRSGHEAEVARLILTASGGPFRGYTREQLAGVTPEDALKHPTWDMGVVVTTNSATLVNKGLEIIEAHLLFDIPFDRIAAVVHPQSVVHSMVEFVDGSVIAQCSPPDMRLPIALGLNWPDRLPGAATACDWTQAAQWTFEPLDEEVFSAVRLARYVGEAGGTYPAVFNAANEEAVTAFHQRKIGFLDIVETVESVVQQHAPEQFQIDGQVSLESVLAAEKWAREQAHTVLGSAGQKGV